MAWQDTLNSLKQELAEARAVRQERLELEELELAEERAELHALADSLGIFGLLSDINATLLEGQGAVETVVSWTGDPDDDGLDDAEELEESDVVTTTLSWDEGSELEVAVDLGLADDGTYLQVNGIEVRLDRAALEDSLVQAFRDELEL
jgi:hypothetical protein